MIAIFTLCIVTILNLIEATPICSNTGLKADKLLCTPGNYTEFVLRRGIVSDNNITTSIILSDCRISDVDFESFHRLPALRSLDLSNNKITRLKLGVLDGFKELTHLNLSYNYLTTFPLGLFDQKLNLIDLDLSSNRINTLELGIFDPLKKLENLDLSSNSLVGANINPYLFDRSKKIKRLIFNGNDMNNAEDNLLHAVTELQTLELNECGLEEVPAFIWGKQLKSLKYLRLIGNRIKEVTDSAFANLTALVLLDLDSNVIETIDENAFKQMKSLRGIYLRNNLLKNIPETLFQNMAALSTIDVSHNLITFVPVNAFRGAKAKYLNLSNNKYTYLQDNFCLELRNSGAVLAKFFFNDNPWECSCLKDIINEVKKFQIIYNDNKYDGKHPVCVVIIQSNGCHRHTQFSEQLVDLYDSLTYK